jgi:hypothetical protein
VAGVYVVTATDVIDGAAAAACTPAYGEPVAAGTIQMTCAATDASGNTTQAAFNVSAPGTVDYSSRRIVARGLITATDVMALRSTVDAVRRLFRLAAFSWTDPQLRPGVTPVAQRHLLELRTALDEACRVAGLTPPAYADAIVARSTLVRAGHFNEVRAAARALLSALPPPPGITSLIGPGARTVSGSGRPGATVAVYIDGIRGGDAVVVDGQGRWSVVLTLRLAAGQTVVAQETANGLAGPTSIRAAVPVMAAALAAATADPLTPLAIRTLGLAPGHPVSVTFSFPSGRTSTTAPIRTDPDGTVVVGVPLYVDAGTITAGGVQVVLSQTLPSTTVRSAAMPLAIRDLPSLASLGTSLGQVTRAVLTFSVLLEQRRITQLQFFQLAGGNTVDTTAARAGSTSLLRATLAARAEIDQIIARPARVVTAADGRVGLTGADVELMDRLLGAWVQQLSLTQAATAASSGVVGFLERLTSAAELSGAVDELAGRSPDTDTRDTHAAFLSGAFASLGAAGVNVGNQLPIISSAFSMFNSWRHVLADAGSLLDRFVDGTTTPEDFDTLRGHLRTAAIDTLAYSIDFGLAVGTITLAPEIALVRLVIAIGSLEVNRDRDAETALDHVLESSQDTPPGGVVLEGHLAFPPGPRPLPGADAVEVCCLTPSGPPLGTITDDEDNYRIPVPTRVPGTTFEPLTLTVSNPMDGAARHEELVTEVSPGTPNGTTVGRPDIVFIETGFAGLFKGTFKLEGPTTVLRTVLGEVETCLRVSEKAEISIEVWNETRFPDIEIREVFKLPDPWPTGCWFSGESWLVVAGFNGPTLEGEMSIPLDDPDPAVRTVLFGAHWGSFISGTVTHTYRGSEPITGTFTATRTLE